MLHPYQIYSDSLKIKIETNFGKFVHLQGKSSYLVIWIFVLITCRIENFPSVGNWLYFFFSELFITSLAHIAIVPQGFYYWFILALYMLKILTIYLIFAANMFFSVWRLKSGFIRRFPCSHIDFFRCPIFFLVGIICVFYSYNFIFRVTHTLWAMFSSGVCSHGTIITVLLTLKSRICVYCHAACSSFESTPPRCPLSWTHGDTE